MSNRYCSIFLQLLLSLSLSLSLLTASFLSPSAFGQFADPDLDGLDDAYELTIGTLPNNHDTDDDGFNDGIEDANRGVADPLNSGFPGFGTVLYDFTNVQESVLQNDNLHRLMPVFNPVDGLSFAYIVAASPGYTNPHIAIATVGDLDSETFITNPGDLPSPLNFHQITYTSDGSAVLFDNDKDIFAAPTLGGGVAQLTIMDATSFVYNPEVVKIDGVEWILAGGRDSTTTALVAWQYGTTPSNGNDVVEIVNLSDSFFGGEDYPRVSSRGNVFSFQARRQSDSRLARTYRAKSLAEIIQGSMNSIVDHSETRLSTGGDFMGFPGGIGIPGNYLIETICRERNGEVFTPNYDLNFPGNFSINDKFNIYVLSLEHISPGDPERIDGLDQTYIPFPGNQPFASLDKNGTKLILCSDFNPFIPGKGEFSLLDMSLGVNAKVVDGPNYHGSNSGYSIVDPSGVTIFIPDGDIVNIPDGAHERIKISTPRIQSNEEVINIRTFEPSGTTFAAGELHPPQLPVGAKLTLTYRDEDIIGLDEMELKIAAYSPVSGASQNLPTTVDLDSNTLEAYITHFSNYAIKGPQYVPSGVENWALQE